MSSTRSLVNFLVLIVSVIPATRAAATLVISSPGTLYTIDFDNTIADVNNGGWTGSGFQPSPTAGQLDSDSWAITGLSDGNLLFGEIKVSGDFARGAVTAAQTTGGLYSRTITPTGRALWIQPSAVDFTPGTLTLRVQNQTGLPSTAWSVSYLLHNLNDQAYSNSFNFSFSTDNTMYASVGALDFSSPADADPSPVVVSHTQSTSISANVADDGFLYLRWSSNDVSGSGSRDEFGLDNIAISMTAVPEPGAVLFGGLVCSVLGISAYVRKKWSRHDAAASTSPNC